MGWKHQLEKGRGIWFKKCQFRPGVFCECPFQMACCQHQWNLQNQWFLKSFIWFIWQNVWSKNATKHPLIFVGPIPTRFHTSPIPRKPLRFDSWGANEKTHRWLFEMVRWLYNHPYEAPLHAVGCGQMLGGSPCRFAMVSSWNQVTWLVGLYVFGMILFPPSYRKS